MASITNPFLTGNLAPVTEEITATDLSVTGRLPEELDGRYVRNGPNPHGAVDPARYHWFTGTGMVHGVRLRGGRAEWYRNRWVRDRELARRMGEEPPASDWPDDHPTFSANTNVIAHAGRTFACVEAGSPPIELTDELDTVRLSDFGGTLPRAFSAHPKRDPATGELHVMTYWWGWGNQVQYLVVGTDGKVRRIVDIPLPGGPMIHDTSITARHVLVFDLPCVFDLESAMAGTSLPYHWNPDYEARVGLMPREGTADDIAWCAIDPCYIFHPMNSWDADDGTVVLDAVRHPRMFDRERRGPAEGDPVLTRWVLDPVTGTSREERFDDRPLEFPRINEGLIGAKNRFGYCAGVGAGFAQDALIKVDLDRGTSIVRTDTDRYGYGEPVFVPRSGATGEDDGWVMVLRHDRENDLSELAVIDARDITDDPVAVVHLPSRVPNGFHGNWMPSTTDAGPTR
jgi:carotenoid cleavage dioxygenase